MTHHVREYLQKMPFRNFSASRTAPPTDEHRDKSSSDEEVLKESLAELRNGPLISENRKEAASPCGCTVRRWSRRRGWFDFSLRVHMAAGLKHKELIIQTTAFVSKVSLPQLLRFAGLKRKSL